MARKIETQFLAPAKDVPELQREVSKALDRVTSRINNQDLTSDLDTRGFRVTNLSSPVLPSDAATKRYVDDAVTNIGRQGVTTTSSSLNGYASMQIFSTAGTATWTKPANVKKVFVEVIGGGGGGYNGSTLGNGGGGGASGGYAASWVDVTLISTVTVIVGTAGVGGTLSLPGGDSSFGTHASAIGGGGGIGLQGGVAGVGSLGSLVLYGNSGGPGNLVVGGGGGVGGEGAPSKLGGGGRGANGALSAADVGHHGGGGGGGSAATNLTGADGGAGIVIVWSYYS